MVPGASFLWLFFTSSMVLLLWFMAARVSSSSRTKKGSEEDDDDDDDSYPLRPETHMPLMSCENYLEDDEEEEEERPPAFEFKFAHQYTGFLAGAEERRTPPTVTNISKYRLLSEKDYSGFVLDPKAVTFRVQESFVADDYSNGDKADKLEARLLVPPADETQRSNSEPEGDARVPEELELIIPDRADEETQKSNSEEDKTENLKPVVPEEMDRATKGLRRSNSDEERTGQDMVVTGIPDVAEESEKLESVGSCEGQDDFATQLAAENNVPGEKIVSKWLSFLPAQSVHGFDFDSESLTGSDGYSVKDLLLDFDSDEFLSENDFVASEHVHPDNADEQPMNAELKPEECSLGSSLTEDHDDTEFSEQSYEPVPGDDLWISQSHRQDRFLKEADLHELIRHANSIISSISAAGSLDPVREENPFLSGSKSVHDSSAYDSLALELSDGEESLQGLVLNNAQSPESSMVNDEYIDLNSERVSLFIINSETADTSCSDHFVCEEDLKSPMLELDDSDKKELENSLNPNQTHVYNSSGKTSGGPSEQDFWNLDHKERDSDRADSQVKKDDKKLEEEEDACKPSCLSKAEFDELESLWEEQDIIELLKSELRKAKGITLPTIQEDESPNSAAEVQVPWRFNVKVVDEDPMNELHKFHKSYSLRMRKLDVLNYQKMNAIRVLRVKDPLRSTSTRNTSFTSILSQSFSLCRRKAFYDPLDVFVKELQDDLETVYVGQSCLSWEILWWQFEKLHELSESESSMYQQYNSVAGEFQQFKVLVQRFLEDEPFREARVIHYVKTRSVQQKILQVPVLKHDCLKNKVGGADRGSEAITASELRDIMAASIRILSQFVKADKDETSSIVKGLIAPQAELSDPVNCGLMMGIRAELHKKEKKLNDLLKVGNCLVKKFKKPQEERLTKDLFFSQVDLRLVSRVLRLPRITTDQLVWCRDKLSCITFLGRTIHREPRLFLFPC